MTNEITTDASIITNIVILNAFTQNFLRFFDLSISCCFILFSLLFFKLVQTLLQYRQLLLRLDRRLLTQYHKLMYPYVLLLPDTYN